MIGSNGAYHAVLMNTIGMAILVDSFKAASKMFSDTQNRIQRNKLTKYRNHDLYPYGVCKESLAFIQGTGLEIILDEYKIPLDPDCLRQTFFSMFKHQEFIE